MSQFVDVLKRQLDVGDHVAFIRKKHSSHVLSTGYILGFTKLYVTIGKTPDDKEPGHRAPANLVIIQKHAFDPSLFKDKAVEV